MEVFNNDSTSNDSSNEVIRIKEAFLQSAVFIIKKQYKESHTSSNNRGKLTLVSLSSKVGLFRVNNENGREVYTRQIPFYYSHRRRTALC